MKNKVLIMLSGGIDSVGVAYIVFTDPKYSEFIVHLHHLNLINVEKRNEPEKISCENIVSYFHGEQFKFEYSESTHEYNFMKNHFIWDLDIVWFIAGVICQNDHSITHIATGRTKSDTLNFGDSVVERRKRGEKIFENLVKTKTRQEIPKFLPVVEDMMKEDLIKLLPKSLLYFTWSCRTPVYKDLLYRRCGVCTTCKEITEIERNLNAKS